MSFSRSAFTGFPFDDSDFGDRDRDQSFRSHIDDIVNRHPELADHLSFDNSFPFGSNTWGSKRRGSTERDTGERPETRRFGRPLRSRFEERFGFPFSSSFDDPYHHQTQESKPPTQESKSQTQEEPAPKQQETQPQKEEKPPQAPPTKERNRKQNSNIQQSNTVDLGQKQEPVTDSRGQRSMSAPPENRSGQQRFVSSINIPMFGQNDTDTHQQPPPQPQPSQQPGAQGKGTERVIPIHVEGRDVPVVPRHDNPSFPPPPQQPQQQTPRNNFGQRPFGHWNRGNSPYYTGDPHFYPEDGQSFGKGPYKSQKPQQQQPPPPQQQQKPQNVQQNQQRATPTPQPQPNETQLPTPPPQQQPTQKLGPIDQIKCIQKNVLELMSEVERFNGKPKDKQYMYLDEMLTRNLLKLDDVETEGKDSIRQARKEAINCIQRCISILEAKAAANEQLRNQLMQIDKVIEESPTASLEVSGISRSGSAAKTNEEKSTPMEVDSEKTEAPKETNAETETNTHETTNENEPKNSCAEEAKISEDNTKVIDDSVAVKKKDDASESG